MEEPDFDQQLAAACLALGSTMAFDAIAGPLTGRLLKALPPRSTVVVYGALSGQPASFDPVDLTFGQKHISAFYLPAWTRGLGPQGLARVARRVQPLLGAELQTTVRATASLAQAPKQIAEYGRRMGEGKVLLVPRGR